ncbi:MAG: helix-turn-helix domain-containing protein [Corynebacterium sp.]|nr:helix-turn-helix domain-containing protein [Corynebacterium sp.]
MDTSPLPATEIFSESLELSTKQRHVLDILTTHPQGLSIHELADQVGSHVNTVRGHLEELKAKGAVSTKQINTEGRGRPSLRYLPRTPDNRAIATEYTTLISLLAEQCATLAADEATTIAREVGQRWAQSLRKSEPLADTEDLMTQIHDLFRRLGFAPEVNADRVALEACPLKNMNTTPSTFLCQVHQGMLNELFGDRNHALELHSYHTHPGCSISIQPRPKM